MARHPFNTPFESGMRSLFILSTSPKPYDLQRLTYFDYLVVHSADFPEGPPSLHPPTPLRSGEFVVRRELVRRGILLMLSRQLIEMSLNSDGFSYSGNAVSDAFIGYFKEPYFNELRERANWANQRYSLLSEEELDRVFVENLGRWTNEFMFVTAEEEEFE
jgi:predicted HTH transcriptional regulator